MASGFLFAAESGWGGRMNAKENSKKFINDSIIKEISSAVESLEYGTVVINVHNKKITQIEIAEKKRFDEVWKLEEGGGI